MARGYKLSKVGRETFYKESGGWLNYHTTKEHEFIDGKRGSGTKMAFGSWYSVLSVALINTLLKELWGVNDIFCLTGHKLN